MTSSSVKEQLLEAISKHTTPQKSEEFVNLFDRLCEQSIDWLEEECKSIELVASIIKLAIAYKMETKL